MTPRQVAKRRRRIDAVIAIQQRAEEAMRLGQFWTAGALFDEASMHAVSPEGSACLRAKAGEARARISAGESRC